MAFFDFVLVIRNGTYVFVQSTQNALAVETTKKEKNGIRSLWKCIFHHSNPFVISSGFSVTVPGYQGNLQAAIIHTSNLAAWERFGVEMVLTFIVVLAYFMSTDSYKSYFGVSSLSVGAAYTACSFVSVSLNQILFFSFLTVSLVPFDAINFTFHSIKILVKFGWLRINYGQIMV